MPTAIKQTKQKRINAAIIDELGRLHEAVRALNDQADEIKASIKAKGVGDYCGKTYRVRVTERDVETLDRAAVRAALPKKTLERCTVRSSSVVLCVSKL